MSVVLPLEFIAIKYPGYFYNTKDKRLYSMKIDGILKPLKKKKAFKGCVMGTCYDIPSGYEVSVKGRRRFVTLKYLESLDIDKFSLIPIVKTKENDKIDENEILYTR